MMDTNRLKRFATEARNILMQGVAHRLQALGFDAEGKPVEEPQRFEGGATFMGDTVTENFYDKWQSLRRAIEWLMQKQSEMEENQANLTARERKELDGIVKQIQECREYHDRLHVIADQQIAFDLDDGVVVNYAKFGDVLAKIK